MRRYIDKCSDLKLAGWTLLLAAYVFVSGLAMGVCL